MAYTPNPTPGLCKECGKPAPAKSSANWGPAPHYCSKKCQDDFRSAKRKLHDYGLSREAWQELKKRFDGSCWICKKKSKYMHVDHNHTTNKVRGWLCVSCNRGLGLFCDNEMLLRAAIEYISTKDD